jgi:hypothetical protein
MHPSFLKISSKTLLKYPNPALNRSTINGSTGAPDI